MMPYNYTPKPTVPEDGELAERLTKLVVTGLEKFMEKPDIITFAGDLVIKIEDIIASQAAAAQERAYQQGYDYCLREHGAIFTNAPPKEQQPKGAVQNVPPPKGVESNTFKSNKISVMGATPGNNGNP